MKTIFVVEEMDEINLESHSLGETDLRRTMEARMSPSPLFLALSLRLHSMDVCPVQTLLAKKV